LSHPSVTPGVTGGILSLEVSVDWDGMEPRLVDAEVEDLQKKLKDAVSARRAYIERDRELVERLDRAMRARRLWLLTLVGTTLAVLAAEFAR